MGYILPDVFQMLLTSSPMEPLLLWSNGPWLTLVQTWDRPFEQHDLVDFTHYLPSLVAPCFVSNLWEARVDADDQVRTVDSGSRYCPMRLYLCDGRNGDTTELQDLITSWSLESYGLQALAGVSDLLRMQIDRFDQDGRKSFQKLQWTSPVFLPYFTNSSMDIHRVPFEVVAVSFHLGAEPHAGHYQTALWHGDKWFTLNDAEPPVTSQHGGAMMVDVDPPPHEEGSLALLSRDQMMENLRRAFSPGRPRNATWLSSIDRLDVDFLLRWPDVCHFLVFNCALCSSQPPSLLDHLRNHHGALFAEAELLTEGMMQHFLMQALPGRVCACHPYFAPKERWDERTCPCLLNFGVLHKFLRATQLSNAQSSSQQLALQLARSFN